MVDPLSGHTAADSTSNVGLRDGDAISSPSLTNLYQAIHGNGILRMEDTAYGATNRNTTYSAVTPGRVTYSGHVVTVQGGYCVLDGSVYQFAGGTGSSSAFTVFTDANHSTGSFPTSTASGQIFDIVVYLVSDNTPKGASEDNVMYEVGTPVSVTAGSPSAPSTFLTEWSGGAASNQQTTVLAVIRATTTGTGTLASGNTSLSSVSDKRAFIRTTALYLTPMTLGAVANYTDTNAVDNTNQKTLNTLFSGDEAGDFAGTKLGAIWQSHSSTGTDVLYYSGTQSTRQTWRLNPEYHASSPSGTTTFKFDGATIFVLNPSTNVQLNPSGTFPKGHTIEITNIHATNIVTFDNSGIAKTVANYAKFAYTGSAWIEICQNSLSFGKHTIWVPAAAMQPTVSNGCATLAKVETTSGRPDMQVLDFDDGSDEHAQFQVAFPKSWNEGVIQFQAYWCSTAADTDGVSWALQGVSVPDNSTIDVAYGTAVVVDDANQGAAEEMLVTAVSGDVTIASAAVSTVTFFRVFRDVSDANDTAAEDARLIGVKLFYTTDTGNDA